MGLTFPQRARPGRRLRQERRRHRRARGARASGTSRSARSPASRSPATRSRGCSGCPRTGRSSTGWASTTTAPRSVGRRRLEPRRGGRPADAGGVRCSASTSARPRWCPRTTRRRCSPTTRSQRAAARAVRRLPRRQRQLAQHPGPAQPAGGRAARAAARRRTPRGRRGRRRGACRCWSRSPPTSPTTTCSPSPTWPSRIGLDGIIATNTTISPRRPAHARAPRSRRSAPAGCPAGRSRERVARGAAAAARPGRRPTSPWSASAASPPSTTPARGSTPGATSQGYTAFVYEGPLWPRRIVARARRHDDVADAQPAPRHRRGARDQAVGAYRHLTLVAPGHRRAVPARQLRRGLRRRRRTLARRALWIHRVRPSAATAPPLERRRRARAAPAPAGWPASPAAPASRSPARSAGRSRCPRSRSRCLLVGEGYAAAPLFPLAERLRERGCAVTLVSPPPTRPTCSPRSRRAARPAPVTVVTADGSVGAARRRRRRARRGARRAGAEVVYAAGPAATLHAVAAAAERHGAWSQIALERAAHLRHRAVPGCPVPVVGEDGVARHGPRLRRRPGLPRRPGPLGRALARPRVTGVGRFANPVLVAAGCGGTGRELAAYGDSTASAASSPARSPSTPGPAARRRGSSRRRAAWSTPIGLQNPGLEPSSPPSCPGWSHRAPASSCRSPAARWGSTPSWRGAWAAPRAWPRIEVNLSAPDAGRQRALRRPRAVPRGQRGRRRAAATCRAACRCWPSSAPTWSASSRPPAPCSTPGPTPSSSATRCRPPCPTAGPAG